MHSPKFRDRRTTGLCDSGIGAIKNAVYLNLYRKLMVTAVPHKPAVKADNLAVPFNHFAIADFTKNFFPSLFLHI